jgi:hemolysin D
MLAQQLAQTRSGFERQVLFDLSDAQKKVEELAQDFVKAERKIAEQVLRAPIHGTVQQLALHTVGGVVTPAQQLMTIVPADSTLEAEAMISNRDIGFVSAGQLDRNHPLPADGRDCSDPATMPMLHAPHGAKSATKFVTQ